MKPQPHRHWTGMQCVALLVGLCTGRTSVALGQHVAPEPAPPLHVRAAGVGALHSFTGAVQGESRFSLGAKLSAHLARTPPSELTFSLAMLHDSATQRNADLWMAVGLLFYPWTPPSPFQIKTSTSRSSSSYTYDSVVYPFVGIDVGLGRYLLRTFGENALLDSTSEYVGASALVGLHVAITNGLRLTPAVQARSGLGIGRVSFRLIALSAELGLTAALP